MFEAYIYNNQSNSQTCFNLNSISSLPPTSFGAETYKSASYPTVRPTQIFIYILPKASLYPPPSLVLGPKHTSQPHITEYQQLNPRPTWFGTETHKTTSYPTFRQTQIRSYLYQTLGSPLRQPDSGPKHTRQPLTQHSDKLNFDPNFTKPSALPSANLIRDRNTQDSLKFKIHKTQ